jgi:hypothetical protein
MSLQGNASPVQESPLWTALDEQDKAIEELHVFIDCLENHVSKLLSSEGTSEVAGKEVIKESPHSAMQIKINILTDNIRRASCRIANINSRIES